jgi:hypothetical protein
MSSAALSADYGPVASKVSRLRLLVRLYVFAESLAALVVVLGVSFWAALALDWCFEPSPAVRIVLWGVVAAAAAFVIWKYLARRFFVRLRDESLALLVERQYPQFQQALLTAVQTSTAGDDFHERLLDQARRRASAMLSDVELRRVFALRPLLLKAVAAAGLIGSIAAFAASCPVAMAFYRQRMQLSPDLWPRRAALSVVGFKSIDGRREVRVARDDDFTLTAFASLVDDHEAPAEVEIRWRREGDGARGGGVMTRIGEALPGRDQAQEYRYRFKATSDIRFDVIGGDDRIRDLRIVAVERPAVTRVTLDCTYPPYLKLSPQTLTIAAAAELPEGATAVCRLESSKPLVRALVSDAAAAQIGGEVEATLETKTTASFAVPASQADRVYLLTLVDEDGVTNREPFRLSVSTTPDEPPQSDARLRGIGSAITPQAQLPWSGVLTDDHALQAAWFEYQADDQGVERRPLRVQPEGLPQLKLGEALDLSEVDPATKRPRIETKPGQRLALAVRGSDAYDLGSAPHEGGSQRVLLDVVTASQLRAILEKRELGLRQRFEAILERVIAVDDLLQRMLAETKRPAASDEAQARRNRQRDDSRLAGVAQTAAQLAQETVGTGEGFDDIVAELINNRVDTEELKQRLEVGIAEPLLAIGGERLPRFEQATSRLRTKFFAGTSGSAAANVVSKPSGQASTPPGLIEELASLQQESAAIVVAMQEVLDRMLELESYNELVELLRGIIDQQQRLEDRTKAEQREKLRSLLDE